MRIILHGLWALVLLASAESSPFLGHRPPGTRSRKMLAVALVQQREGEPAPHVAIVQTRRMGEPQRRRG